MFSYMCPSEVAAAPKRGGFCSGDAHIVAFLMCVHCTVVSCLLHALHLGS